MVIGEDTSHLTQKRKRAFQINFYIPEVYVSPHSNIKCFGIENNVYCLLEKEQQRNWFFVFLPFISQGGIHFEGEGDLNTNIHHSVKVEQPNKTVDA